MSDQELLVKIETMRNQRKKHYVKEKKAIVCSLIMIGVAFVLSVFLVAARLGGDYQNLVAMYTKSTTLVMSITIFIFAFFEFMDQFDSGIDRDWLDFSYELRKAEHDARKRGLIK